MYEIGSSPKSHIESLELVRLHSPPHVLGKLLDICNDPDGSVEDLARVIDTDAALTSRVIMAVNSVAFSISEPIENLQRAIGLLGHERVKTMVLTMSIQQLFSGLIPSQKEFVCNAWLDSLYCALFAERLAVALDYESPGDAYLAGLLHDFGQIVFDAKHHEQYVEVIQAQTEAEIIDKEILKFGTSHNELGADIVERWPSLSMTIADAIRFHHEDEIQLRGADLLCRIVAEASELAWHWCRNGKPDTKWRSNLLEQDALKALYAEVLERIVALSGTLEITASAAAGPTQAELASHVEKETIRMARKIRDTSLVKLLSCDDSRSPAGRYAA